MAPPRLSRLHRFFMTRISALPSLPWRGFCATLAGGLLGLSLLGCSGRKPPRVEPAESQRSAAKDSGTEATSPAVGRLALRGSALSGANEQGETIWRAQADRIDFDETAQVANLHKVVCTFLEAGKPVSRYHSDKMTAHFSEPDRRLEFSGTVHVESLALPASAESDRATYLWDARSLLAEKHVVLKRGELTITGSRLEGDVALHQVEIIGSPARLASR